MMDRMGDEDDAGTFIHLEGLGGPDGVALSRGAFMMHSFGIQNSFEWGTPGYVPDEYLNAISADSTTAVVELCAVGLWRRAKNDQGYDVLDDETVEFVRRIRERTATADFDETDD